MRSKNFREREISRSHTLGPKAQAGIDFQDGMDIGYNPYPFQSDNWFLYRDAFNDCYARENAANNEIALIGGEPTGG